jgi:streptogrisin C
MEAAMQARGRRMRLFTSLGGITLVSVVLQSLSVSVQADGDGPSLTNSLVVRSVRYDHGSMLVKSTDPDAFKRTTAERDDLVDYSEQRNVDRQVILRAFRGVSEFSILTTKLEEEFPDIYVRSGMSPERGAWIQFTSKPTSRLIAPLKGLPVDVRLSWGAPASSAELAAMAESMAVAMGSQSSLFTTARTGYDSTSQRMSVRYTPAPDASEDQVSAGLQSVLAAGLVDGVLPLPVDLIREDGVVRTQEVSVRGGHHLDPGCTSGFTAVRAGSGGVLSADHCNISMAYDGNGTVLNNAFRLASRTTDIQWYRIRTGHNMSTQFTVYSTNRTVKTVANAVLGSIVCHYGRASSERCANIVAIDQCITYPGGVTRCGIDITQGDVSAGGDSGGPWYSGNQANGIHSGATAGFESYFTRIGRVSLLDAYVPTG